MWLCTDWKIDWNAISAVATAAAALIALCVWLFDKHQRKLERNASARLLAQIMTTPVGAAHVQISKFSSDLFPSGSDPLIGTLREDKDARKRLVEKASAITIELPSQFLDKADLFSEATSSSLANVFSEVNRLKQFVGLFGDLADQEQQEVIDVHLMTVLNQIKTAEKAAETAFQALLVVGQTSR
jgi:inorganic triphosphatase YgiF